MTGRRSIRYSRTLLGSPISNLNAWIDCLTCADDAEAQMVGCPVPNGEVLTLQLDNVDEFAARCPEQYEAVLDCAAFVNWRRIERGNPPILALSFHRNPEVPLAAGPGDKGSAREAG